YDEPAIVEAKHGGRMLAEDGRAEDIAVEADRALDVGDDQHLGHNDAILLRGSTERTCVVGVGNASDMRLLWSLVGGSDGGSDSSDPNGGGCGSPGGVIRRLSQPPARTTVRGCPAASLGRGRTFRR